MLVLLLACRCAQEVPPADGGVPVDPSAYTAKLWTSASCGDRAYPRELTLAQGGTYSGRDLVSPCPEGTTCIWSGIIDFSGGWAQAHDLVTLSESTATPGPGTARPKTVRYESAGKTLVDDLGCAYVAG